MSQDEYNVKVKAIRDSLTKILDDALDTLDKHHQMQRQRIIDEHKQTLRLIEREWLEQSVKVNGH